MATKLNESRQPETSDTTTAELTTIICECGYSESGHMDSETFPTVIECKDCGRKYHADFIRKNRRAVRTEEHDMRYWTEDKLMPHKRRMTYYVFETEAHRQAVRLEIQRMQAIGAKAYIAEVVDRTREMAKRVNVKQTSPITETADVTL